MSQTSFSTERKFIPSPPFLIEFSHRSIKNPFSRLADELFARSDSVHSIHIGKISFLELELVPSDRSCYVTGKLSRSVLEKGGKENASIQNRSCL